MEEYDVGFCPLLPKVVRLCFDIAWSRFKTSSKVVPKVEAPPPFLHDLAPIDVEGINEKASLGAGLLDLTECFSWEQQQHDQRGGQWQEQGYHCCFYHV